MCVCVCWGNRGSSGASQGRRLGVILYFTFSLIISSESLSSADYSPWFLSDAISFLHNVILIIYLIFQYSYSFHTFYSKFLMAELLKSQSWMFQSFAENTSMAVLCFWCQSSSFFPSLLSHLSSVPTSVTFPGNIRPAHVCALVYAVPSASIICPAWLVWQAPTHPSHLSQNARSFREPPHFSLLHHPAFVGPSSGYPNPHHCSHPGYRPDHVIQ